MTTLTIPKLAITSKAYGFELQLWKEDAERTWGATLSNSNLVVSCHFEEDNLMLAKLYLLGEARNRAIEQSNASNLPGCDTFLDSWKAIRLTTGPVPAGMKDTLHS
jgi:hypothetical protein